MNSLNQADRKFVLHPFTNLSNHESEGPVIIERGEGIYIWDDQGNRLLEGMSGLWCASLGFSEQRLAEAAAKQFAMLVSPLLRS